MNEDTPPNGRGERDRIREASPSARGRDGRSGNGNGNGDKHGWQAPSAWGSALRKADITGWKAIILLTVLGFFWLIGRHPESITSLSQVTTLFDNDPTAGLIIGVTVGGVIGYAVLYSRVADNRIAINGLSRDIDLIRSEGRSRGYRMNDHDKEREKLRDQVADLSLQISELKGFVAALAPAAPSPPDRPHGG